MFDMKLQCVIIFVRIIQFVDNYRAFFLYANAYCSLQSWLFKCESQWDSEPKKDMLINIYKHAFYRNLLTLPYSVTGNFHKLK